MSILIPWSALLAPAPKIPSAETVAKWTKAAEDPSALTFEDRQKLLKRHPFAESNEFCIQYTGMDLDALIEKAAHTNELTLAEASISSAGTARWMENGDKEMLDETRWPANVRGAYEKALNAILTDTERKAELNGSVARTRYNTGFSKRLGQLSDDDRKNVQWISKIPWIGELDQRPGHEQWGFVCIRTSFQDDAAWRHFQDQFTAAVELSVSVLGNGGRRLFWTPDRLLQRWKIQWIEDPSLDSAGLDILCPYFRRLKDEGNIDPSLRQDAFLYADQDAIQSSQDHYPLPERGFVVAADPSHDPSKLPTYHHEFKGNVRIALTAVFTSFYARLIPRGDPEDDPTNTRGLRQSWDVIYLKASRYNKVDGTYPPASISNR